MSVQIRQAEPRDATRLVELARDVGAEPGGWLITDGEWRSVGEERRHLRRVRSSRHACVLVAELDHALVGRLSIARDSQPACAHVADLGLMVARHARRQGVGRALLEAAEQWARSAGVTKIELHVFPHNDAAIGLYEGAGYQREGYRRSQYRRGTSFVDAIVMAKMIS